MTDKNIEIDRVEGALIGVALGDALGMPTEFMSRDEIKASFGRITEFITAPDWHPLADLPAGKITDDTEQTLTIAKLVKEKPDFTPVDVAEAMLDWARNSLDSKFQAQDDDSNEGDDNLNKMGPSTLQALSRYARGESPYTTGLTGNTNGAAIRVSPVALANPGAPEGLAERILTLCIPTHCTEVAVAGSCAAGYWISRAAAGGDKAEAYQAALAGCRQGSRLFRERIRGKIQDKVEQFADDRKWQVLSSQINPGMLERIKWAEELTGMGGTVGAAGVEAEGVEAAGREQSGEQLKERIYERLLKSLGTGVLMIETVPLALSLARLTEDPFEAVVLGASAGGDTDSIASITGGLMGSLAGRERFPARLVKELERKNEIDFALLAEGLVQTGS